MLIVSNNNIYICLGNETKYKLCSFHCSATLYEHYGSTNN
jgi:hypothetical protein